MAAIQDRVQPGDVITSDLLNRIIGLLNAHDALLLAAQPASPDAPTITSFVPGPPWQAGQAVQIIGTRFGFSTGGTVLKFDDVQINAFKLGSSDTSLLVNVPVLADLGAAGRDVLLTLANGSATVSRVVRVTSIPAPQQGNVDVLPNDAITPNPNPNPIVTGQPATLAYVASSRALLPGTFAISVRCSDATMQAAALVLNASQQPIASRQIDLAPGQQAGFFVRFPSVSVAANASFSVTVTTSSAGAAGSDTRSYTVGQPVTPPDTSITLAFNALTASDPNTGAPDSTAQYTAADNTVRLRALSIGRVSFLARFTRAGTYNVSVQAASGTNAWAVVLANTPAQYVVTDADIATGGGSTTRNPQIGVQAQAGATATGQASITLQRQGDTTLRALSFNLALLP